MEIRKLLDAKEVAFADQGKTLAAGEAMIATLQAQIDAVEQERRAPLIKQIKDAMPAHISSHYFPYSHENLETFHQEKADIFEAGLKSTRYQQIDDTGTKVNGENQYVQIICNPFYTAYFTIPTKDRMSILGFLQGGKARIYF